MLADETTPVCQLGVIGLHKRSLILPDCRIVMPRWDLTLAVLRVRANTLETRQQSCASDRSDVAENMRVDFNDLLSAWFYAAYKLLTVVICEIRRRRVCDRYSANWQSVAR